MVNFCFRITWISENSDTVSAEATPRGSFEVSADFQTDTLRAPQLRDKVYGIWKQMVNGGIKQEELTKALAYFSKSYLEDGDKADRGQTRWPTRSSTAAHCSIMTTTPSLPDRSL